MSIPECIALLKARGVPLDVGLTQIEISRIEKRYAFEFSPDHRRLLETGQPIGKGWTHWKKDSPLRLRAALDQPLQTMSVSAERGAFWPQAWGERPIDSEKRKQIASRYLQTWPILIPLFGNCYMPAAPAPAGAPVFSLYHGDVVVFGRDLPEWLHYEMGSPDLRPGPKRPFDPEVCPPWSRLAVGLGIDD